MSSTMTTRILGVVDDVGELLGEEADVERVEHRAHARDGEVGLEVLLGVPQNVATRSPDSMPRRRSAAASRSARAATSANDARRLPSPSKVTTSLSPCTVRPWRKIMPTVSGKSCIVTASKESAPRARARDRRAYSGTGTRGSTAVVHAGVVHREHRGVLVELEAGVDDLAEEQGVTPELDGLAHLAVEVGDGLVEDRGAGDAVVEGEPVERARARSTSTGFVNLRTIARSSCRRGSG